ncbi:putative sulfate exporter family transporter [Pseudodesulfovibrio thermohalotolerans]|uniref:YeiH family protein n=1 Tax=Pseudodesulfovibrio thermohalotolerans TaxID=2880651 RepID=UPI00244282F3|nr:putative sulfate exporter family transporter [Pseudodesulfovibrio thermohalotolerans]WFS63100.1 putative sulfate exporter family transporter [Pseudodesulfovibrio thermohalotolerans]
MTIDSRTMDGTDVQKAFINEVLESLPGILLVISVAVFAHFAAPLLLRFEFFKTYLTIKDFILAILVGIAIRNTVGVPGMLQPGLRFSTILTKTGIVVMGAKYSLAGLVTVGGQALGLIFAFLFGSAILLMWIGKKLNVSPSLSACLAAGLSVCGVSATIAVSPAVNAKKEEMAYSIAVVLMFGLLALVVFPPLGRMLELSDAQYGAFAGVGIINSAQVLAAGFGFSDGAGVVAGVYNIGRVLFLPFVVLMLTILACQRETTTSRESINKWQIIVSKFPVFVLGFLAIVLMNTAGMISAPAAKTAKVFMEWAFLLGFASIGLTTRLSDLKAAGLTGIVVGFTVASLKAGLALIAVLYFIN